MAGVESSNQIAVGDIIVFSYDGISVVHRVVLTGIDANGWYAITRGDNNAAVDGKVRFAQIEGVVVGIV
jgi:signal peptidase I